ncbi:hypothetical protein LRR18_04685 [Mangrovimonas sp. AS39]|uniref:hypothetical protein n=1 Tax=Mangrovimonas TaxID=1211036 RepID=UPI0006B4F46C|nr:MULTISPECIES: hypothetical protein [Mangrovimonas]MCF1190872.1 hypothetical protein [Mangrovimonas futianensis]MCF1194568.1 hypothetical protein [Mangrovimonas futianensis]MCF1420326.1 hypothetical protein [Mangrovimonas futianensis]NIK91427.1 hypothetical protein [Mangrovimonas sp. CR14]
METKISYLSDLKFNLETWIRELRFHFNEMETFKTKLEEIASREYTSEVFKPLEMFENRIALEKDAISKLIHRCKQKMHNLEIADMTEAIDGRLLYEQRPLRDDIKTYLKLHYELKEEMMDYFLKWLN